MSAMNADEFELAMDWAEGLMALPDADVLPEPVLKAKVAAIKDSIALAREYRRANIRSDLVRIVLHKRFELIRAADKVGDLREIAAPPKPHFNGNRVIPGRFDVPEEEMILWSITSLKGPLVPAGFDRYMELFRQVFGVDINDPNAQQQLEHIKLEVD